MKPLLLAVALIVLAAAACGDDTSDVQAGPDDPPASDAPASDTPADAIPATDTVYRATATVLESDGHGPQLCLGGVAESYPPQCGGPDIVGWDWSTVEAESAGGTTWGTYAVTGTWDGETFTLTGPAEPDGYSDPGPSTTFDTPCDEPEGGWQVVDASTATLAGQDAAIAYAQAQPEFAGVWIDQSINPGADDDPIDEFGMNDPTKLILNVRFTGDVDRHEAELRERFGGSLCVTEADRTEAELRAIQQEVFEELDGFHASTDIIRGVVEIGVIVADPAVQADLDERYGDGVVELRGALQPVG